MKKLFSLLLAAAMIGSAVPAAMAEDVTSDVQGHWAQDAIEYLADKGDLNQLYEGQNFGPDEPITRNALVFMLMNAFEYQAGNQEEFFKNITALSWYVQPSSMADISNVRLGVGELANADQYVTRQELAALVGLAGDSIGVEWNTVRQETFADDAEIPTYVKSAVYLLAGSGVIKGVTDTEFAPTAYATRAQAATMIYRVAQLAD